MLSNTQHFFEAIILQFAYIVALILSTIMCDAFAFLQISLPVNEVQVDNLNFFKFQINDKSSVAFLFSKGTPLIFSYILII